MIKSCIFTISSKFAAAFFLLTAFSLSFYAQENNINIRPLKDFADEVAKSVAEKKVDLNEPFSIEVVGNLSKDGKITDAKVKTVSGKDQIVEIAKNSIKSLSDSQMFKFLSDAGCREIFIRLSQDEKEVVGIIKSDLETKAKAKQMQIGLNLIISVKKQQAKDEEEKFLFNNFSVGSEGKALQLNFRAPREEVQQLIEKTLEEAALKKKNG